MRKDTPVQQIEAEQLSQAGLSRRAALGLGAASAALSLAACATGTPPTAEVASPAFDGAVSFAHGVASGDPDQTSVVLWTRVSVAGEASVPVRWRVARDAALTDVVASGVFTTSAARDYTVKVIAEGLSPAAAYHYGFDVAGTASPVGRTRTLARSGKAPFKLAFFSCSNYPAGFFNAYKAMADRGDIDFAVHLGDYIYEYGADGYATEFGRTVGRVPDPVVEIVTLGDYRARLAQYRTDLDLQAAHAACPWFVSWDDHETTNDSWRDGAENHNPEDGEGDWGTRKGVAVQAYLEWMPVREPAPGQPRSALWRTFSFGELASLTMLESRLTGRSEGLDWGDLLEGATTPAEIMAKAGQGMAKAADPARTMLGTEQEAWLAELLKASTAAGHTWQILGNQVIMARVVPPNVHDALPAEQRAELGKLGSWVENLIQFTRLGLPWNLDAWDGYPAARARLYAAAEAAGARLITLTGDTHTAWANELLSGDKKLGAEFGCTSVSSPGMGDILKLPGYGQMMAEKNDDVVWHNPDGRGFSVLSVSAEAVTAEFVLVSTAFSKEFTTRVDATFRVTPTAGGITGVVAV
jgi:phosphodiesterase/alkaline phosphatase D-like protein